MMQYDTTLQSAVLQFFALLVIYLLSSQTPFVVPRARRKTFTSTKVKNFPVRPPSAS